MTIQNISYRNKFTYSFDIDPTIMDCKILKIVLQPLVENAIYHGIKNKADAGHILIKGVRSSDGIELQAIDDGVGTDAAKLNASLARGRPHLPASASATGGLLKR